MLCLPYLIVFLKMARLVTPKELKTATGHDRLSDIEKYFRKNGVRFLYGKTEIYTTIDVINAAMGITTGKTNTNDNNVYIL